LALFDKKGLIYEGGFTDGLINGYGKISLDGEVLF
jgi:hypothetical protein